MSRTLSAIALVVFIISAPAAFASEVRTQPAREALGSAWILYDDGRYAEAAVEFEKSLSEPTLRHEAMLGLGYARMRLGARAEAIGAFKELQRLSYKRAETAPALIGLLLEEGRAEDGLGYIGGVRDLERPLWRRRVLATMMNEALAGADASEKADNFIRRFERESRQCSPADVFLKMAEWYIQKGHGEKGIKILDDLGASCGMEYQFAEPGRLKVSVLRRAIAELPEGEPERAQLGLELEDALRGAYPLRAALGWHYFNANDMRSAGAIFNSLNADEPENPEYALGLALSLREIDDERVVAISGKFLGSRDEFKGMLRDALMRQARSAYDAGQYADAMPQLERVLGLDQNDREARVLYAWSLHNLGRRHEALPLLEQLYDEEPDPGLWRLIFDSALAEADRTRGIRLARKAGASGSPEVIKPAAGYLMREGCPGLAAELDPSEGACYQNANSPSTSLSAGYRRKSGTEGLSRLDDYTLAAQYNHPLESGCWLLAKVDAHLLSSGDAASDALVGSPYLGGSSSRLDASASIYEMRLGYAQEGALGLEAEFGASPIGGAVDSAPVYRLALNGMGLRAGVHQEPVRETVLSYAGLKDPYSGKSWGRVMRTGVDASYRIEPGQGYSIALSGALERYRGEGVEDNASRSMGASFGRSFTLEPGGLYTGIYLAHSRFEHDQNHFTLGHGGYFSPSSFVTAGLSLAYKGRQCERTAFDLSAALGWLSHSSGPAAYYPADPAAPRTYYPRSDVSSLGGSAEARWLRLIGSGWALGGSVAIDRSADYSEARVMVMLASYNRPRSSAVLGDDDLRR